MVLYEFDYAGRPVSAAVDGAPLVTSASYEPFGPRSETAFANGTIQRWTGDTRYQPVTNTLLRGTTPLATYRYETDDAGNITAIHDELDAAFNRDFGYDDLNRLTRADGGTALWGNGSYAYDAMGNLQTLALGGARNALFAYEGTTPKLTSVTENAVTRAVAYDAAGNEQLVGAEGHAYSPRNRLVSAGDFTYVYDGRGIRTISSAPLRLPTIASFEVSPASVRGGETATATVTLSAPAPDGGLSIGLTSGSGAVLPPAFLAVAAGSTSGSAILETSAVSSDVVVTLTATLEGAAQTTTLSVRAPRLAGLALGSSEIKGGTPVTGTVTLDAAAPEGGLAVALASSNGAASVPAQVVVVEGEAAATFTVGTTPVGASVTATITATLAETTRSSALTIAPPGLAQLQFEPRTLHGGATTSGTIALGGPAPAGGAMIALSSHSTALTVPAAVLVPAGASSATFTATASPVEASVDVVVTSVYLGTSQTGIVTVTSPDLVSFEVLPAMVIGGEVATAQATLDAPAASSGATIEITASDGTLVPPATLVVPATATTGSASLPTNPVATSTSVVVSATRNGIARSSSITLEPPPVTLASLSIAPASLVGSNTATGTVTLTNPAPAAGLEIGLTSSDPAHASVPAALVVPAGGTQGTFAIGTTLVATSTTVTITATHAVTAKSATLTLQPASGNYVASLSASPQFIVGGSTATGTVALASASTTGGGSVVLLTSSDPSVIVPGSVTVKKNQTSEAFTIATGAVAEAKAVALMASYGGVVQRLTVIVAPANMVTLASFVVSPQRVVGGNPVTATLTLSASAPFGGATVSLTPSRRNMVTMPESVTVAEGVTSTTFAIGTELVHGKKDRAVDIEAAYNGITGTATLTLVPSGVAANASPAVQCASTTLVTCLTANATNAVSATAVRVDRYSFYTPELTLLAESEESGADAKPVRYSYIWFAGQPLAQIDNTTGQIGYYVNDHLGTPILQISSMGDVIWRVEREPFGKIVETRVGADRHQPLSFPGQEDDGSSELSYNIFRHHRAGWGRYTQADPFSPWAAAAEPYAYARGNPLLSVDPLGLFEIRRTWDFRRTPPGTPGDSGHRIDFEHECKQVGGCWKLTFTIPVDFTMQYDDEGTYAHEWRHLQILESYLYPLLNRYFGPPERRSYPTLGECRDAARTATNRYIRDYNPFQGYWRHLLHDLSDPGHHSE